MHGDDASLVQRCLSGEAAAWDALVERYGRLVYSIPRRLRLSGADSEDVFQTVFSIALRRLDTLKDAERLSAWLIRTTYRECWRMGRRRKATALDAADETVADEAPPPELAAKWERQHGVHQALTEIDERCRTLLTALFLEAETPDYAVIAARLGMPVGSIGPTRARCFKKLETVLLRLGFSA